MSLKFEPVRTADEVIFQLMEVKNKIALLNIKHNKLIDELSSMKGTTNNEEE